MSEQESGEILIYQSEAGETRLEVQLAGETVWLTQKLMAELFQTTPENILIHLKNIFDDNELDELSTTKDFLVVRQEGAREVRRRLKHYNLDAIISVGYRVNSLKPNMGLTSWRGDGELMQLRGGLYLFLLPWPHTPSQPYSSARHDNTLAREDMV